MGIRGFNRSLLRRWGLFLVSALLLVLPASPAFASCCVCHAAIAPDENICLKSPTNGDCESFPTTGKNPKLKELTCVSEPNDAKCRTVPNKGVCQQGPMEAGAFSGVTVTTTNITVPGDFLTLGVPIPGLTFSTTLVQTGKKYSVPWLAQYIAAIQRYLLSVVVVAAGVMIVYGGFLYIGGTAKSVAAGKEIIQDALIGLVLVLTAVLILQTVNPATIQPQEIKIKEIDKRIIKLDTTTTQAMASIAATEFKPDPDTVEALKNIKGSRLPPKRQRPDNPFDTRETLDAGEINQVTDYVAKKTGIDDVCIIKAIMGIESGNAINAIGHDEDAPIRFNAPSRIQFLIDKKKWSGETFEGTADTIYNDDTSVTAAPPDFGLDWRYSHGIGLTQLTIFPKGCRGANGELGLRHPATGNVCWTTPILLTLEGTIDLTIAALKTIKDRGATEPCEFFMGWAGPGGKVCSPLLVNKQEAYAKCKAGG